MISSRELTAVAAGIQAVADALGMGKPGGSPESPTPRDFIGLYDELVTSELLRLATRKLFVDEHYARSVEEACKCLNHTVKAKSGETLDGVSLMQKVFSEKNPVLKINGLRTVSQRDEQAGYQMIMAGLMMGIRNPRAHELQLWDSPIVALELLMLTNHLMRIVEQSTRARKKKAP